MSVLVFHKSTPEGAEAVRAGAVQAAFHRTTLVVHNVPHDAAEAEEVLALASGAAAGEGVETMLSLRQALTTLPAAAALSAAHLAALRLQPTLRRLYIARERDDAGQRGAETLATRAREAGIEALMLDARGSDFNDDLRRLGLDALRADLRVQLAPEDVARFMSVKQRDRAAA